MKGYTLLEILVAIAVIGIMAAGGYPKLTFFSQEVRLQEEAKIVFSDLCLLQQAGIAAGTGTTTFNLFLENDADGNPVGVGYELKDSWGNFIRPSFLDATMSRDLAFRSVCISPTNTLPASTTPNVCFVDFSSTGSPSVLFSLNVRHYQASPSRRINDSVGTWTIFVTTDTLKLILKNGTRTDE
jgi:prepilin-type N-terminal cleavage/methylation domain-containing protein